jgi:hypothetical protein
MAISKTPSKPACYIGVFKIAIAGKPAPTQSRTTHIPCGSWLASDGNLQNTTKPACYIGVFKIAIAGKPAPTQSRITHITCGSWLASDGNL